MRLLTNKKQIMNNLYLGGQRNLWILYKIVTQLEITSIKK